MDDQLTPREVEALRRLEADRTLPPPLEENVVRTLREEGLLASTSSRRRPAWRILGTAAAALLLFLAGAASQRWLLPAATSAPTEAPNRWVLLLLEPGDSVLDPAVETERVREYSAWARELAAGDILELGEKLADAGELVGPPLAGASAVPGAVSSERLAGFFVIRADDEEEALEIAGSCPHVLHGGRIEVRRIVPT